jgi:hypothetical protein
MPQRGIGLDRLGHLGLEEHHQHFLSATKAHGARGTRRHKGKEEA